MVGCASSIRGRIWNDGHSTGFDPDKQKWELYNIDEDFTQANDLAAKNPQKLRELQDLWWAEAAKYHVLPLDWRASERLNAELMGRPELGGKRSKLTYYPGQLAVPNDASPRVLNKSWSVTADLNIPENGAEGMIVTHGGITGGYGLYLRAGKPATVVLSANGSKIAEGQLPQTVPIQFSLGEGMRWISLTRCHSSSRVGSRR